jgi:hypothetical protein
MALVGDRFQELEDQLWNLHEAVRVVTPFDPLASTDQTQNRVAKILGARGRAGSESAAFYTTLIQSQIAVNSAWGTLADVLAAQFPFLFGARAVAAQDENDTPEALWGSLGGRCVCLLEDSTNTGNVTAAALNEAMDLINSMRPSGNRVVVGAQVAPANDSTGTLFRLDSSVSDGAALLYTHLDKAVRP